MSPFTPGSDRHSDAAATTLRDALEGARLAIQENDQEDALAFIAAASATLSDAQTEWNPEHEGNKLILLFEGYIYGDKGVTEGMVVAAIHRFRTKEPIWLNPDRRDSR